MRPLIIGFLALVLLAVVFYAWRPRQFAEVSQSNKYEYLPLATDFPGREEGNRLEPTAVTEEIGEAAGAQNVREDTSGGAPLGSIREPLLEQRLRDEPVDVTWAPTIEARLYEVVSAMELKVSSMHAVCRTSVCRLELTLEASGNDPEERRKSGRDIAMALKPVVEENLQHLSSIEFRPPTQPPYTYVLYLRK